MAQTLAQFEAVTLSRLLQLRLRFDLRLNLFIQQTLKKKELTVRQRVRIATQFLVDRIRINLSRPVRRIKSQRTGRIAVDPNSRSRAGEFPRADTTRLKKDIFLVMDDTLPIGRAGTTLKYGLILETQLDRSFLRRTLNELRAQILVIIQGGTVGGASNV